MSALDQLYCLLFLRLMCCHICILQFSVVLVFCYDMYVCLVSKFAREKIQPLVREMDEKGHMPDHLIKDLFGNGVKYLKNLSFCGAVVDN